MLPETGATSGAAVDALNVKTNVLHEHIKSAMPTTEGVGAGLVTGFAAVPSAPTETKNELLPNTAHDVLQARVVCILLLHYLITQMSEASSFRIQLLARKAALEARSTKEAEHSEERKPVLQVGPAQKAGASSSSESDGSSPQGGST